MEYHYLGMIFPYALLRTSKKRQGVVGFSQSTVTLEPFVLVRLQTLSPKFTGSPGISLHSRS